MACYSEDLISNQDKERQQKELEKQQEMARISSSKEMNEVSWP